MLKEIIIKNNTNGTKWIEHEEKSILYINYSYFYNSNEVIKNT